MKKVNISSKNQSGGITANNVSIYGDNPNRKKKKYWKFLVEIIATLSGIVVIFAYFKFFPFVKSS